jgi:hypothetical protein
LNAPPTGTSTPKTDSSVQANEPAAGPQAAKAEQSMLFCEALLFNQVFIFLGEPS